MQNYCELISGDFIWQNLNLIILELSRVTKNYKLLKNISIDKE